MLRPLSIYSCPVHFYLAGTFFNQRVNLNQHQLAKIRSLISEEEGHQDDMSVKAIWPLSGFSVDQQNLLGVERDKEPGCAIVTLGRNIVIRYKVGY